MYDARQVANELVRRKGLGTLTPMQVLKLVYLCHGWMLGLYGQPLLIQPVQAWRFGPVVPDVYYALKHYRKNRVTRPIDLEAWGVTPQEFGPREENLMDQVLDIYGGLSGPKLSALTHRRDSPWRRVWQPGSSDAAVIPNSMIERYYATGFREVDNNGK